jgi:hypothetical protein
MHADKRVLGVAMGLVVLALLLCFASAAFAQSATGTITGTVTDPKGLAMANATITVHNADTGVDLKPVRSNDAGSYVMPLLPPDNYDITVTQAGFATVERKGVELQIGQTVRVDFQMPVQSQQSLVTVTTEVPLLDTEKTEQSQNITETLVSDLPVSSRRWEQFALLTPGVNTDGALGGMSFHGINNLYNHNAVDGASNDSNYSGGPRGAPSNDGYVYSDDSIREFQVASSGFDVEIGASAGGAVNAVTKSGTSQFHGDLFYNGRSNAFNAFDPVAKALAASTGFPPSTSIHQQHQWGGSAGGPIIKDKLFFFVTDDGYRKVDPLTQSTVELDPSIQNFTCPTVTGAGLAAGATAPSAAQCQAAKDYFNTHFVGAFPRILKQDVELVKLDYQLNSSNHMSAVANIRDWDHANSTLLQTQSSGSFIQDRFVIANWSTVIGSNKVNELRYQYGIDHTFSALNGTMGMPGVVLTGITTSPAGGGGYGLSGGGTSFALETRNQVTDNFSWTKGAHQFKFGTDLNFIRDQVRTASNSGGNYGFSKGHSMMPNVACAAPSVTSGQSTANKENLIFCNWLEDLYGDNALDGRFEQHWDTFNQYQDFKNAGPPASFSVDFPNTDVAGYVQDTWKVRPNLTANLGFRYDVQLMTDLPNTVAKLLPLLPTGSFDVPILDKYTSTFPNDFGAVQPRIGVAWNFRKNTVLRFSAGTFVAKTEGHIVQVVDLGIESANTNCTTPQTVLPASNASCIGALNFPNVYFYQQNAALWTPPLPGAVPVKVQTPAGNIAVPNPKFGVRSIDPAFRRPRVYSFNLAIEQQLPWNMNLSVGYNYTRGIALSAGVDLNISPSDTDPNYCSTALSGGAQTCNGLKVNQTYDIVDANGNTQSSITLPFYSSRASIGAAPGVAATSAYSDRVDPRLAVLNGNSSVVVSTYSGMIVTLRKPTSRGLEFLLNYTYSHALDDGEQGGGNSGENGDPGEGYIGTTFIDPFNARPEKGNSGNDTRHRFTGSVVYAPTFTKKIHNKIAKEFADGWALSSSIIAQSGQAYTGLVNSGAAPSVSYTGYSPGSTAPTTFTYTPLDGSMGGAGVTSPGGPLPGRIAWVAPGSFVLPSLYNVDLRLEKQFSIKERYHIAIRGEAFNLFNSTLVQAVNQVAYDYATPGSAGCVGHVNTCMVPLSNFGQATATTGNLLGARQMQAGIRFEF